MPYMSMGASVCCGFWEKLLTKLLGRAEQPLSHFVAKFYSGAGVLVAKFS